jgi:hypothetical protein
MKVKRFYWVRSQSPRSRVVHIAFSHIESPTACGVHMEPGWSYWLKPRGFMQICKRCANSSKTNQKILVQRVRRVA